MPYIKKTIIAGDTIEIEKHYSARYGRRCQRSANSQQTRPEQAEVNQRQAEKTLRRLINANFGVGDIHLVLGYKREHTRTPEQARKDKEQFLRGYRRWCKEQGETPRYITVTEYENKRVHHHLVIGAVPMAVLYELWPWGRPHITPLDSSGNYGQLAAYLIKETSRTFERAEAPQRKRWTQSKGLKKPEIKREEIRADRWAQEPKPKQGYFIPRDSVINGVCAVTGAPYQQYMMIRNKGKRGRKGNAPPAHGHDRARAQNRGEQKILTLY